MKNILIIDGHNLAFRAYHTVKAKTPSDQMPDKKDEVIYIFLNSFISYYKLGDFQEVVFAWDHKLDYECKNFRKTLSAYKENRDHTPDNTIFTIIDELLTIVSALGCKNILPKSLEADDIIYHLCKNHTGKKTVVSSDKDLLQIVDEDTTLYSPTKKIIYNNDNFRQLVGMTTEQFIIYKAVLGDPSDNIPGVPKYGTKKSLTVANNWPNNTFDSDQLAIVENNRNIMDLSRAKNFVSPDEFTYFDEQYNNTVEFDTDTVKNIFKEKGFTKFLYNFHDWTKLQTPAFDMWDLIE